MILLHIVDHFYKCIVIIDPGITVRIVIRTGSHKIVVYAKHTRKI